MDLANFETYLRGQEYAMIIILKSFGAVTPAITTAVAKHCARLNREVTNLSVEHARANAQPSASSSTPASATATAQPTTPAKTPTKPGFFPGGAATLFKSGGAAMDSYKSRAGSKKPIISTSDTDSNDSRGSPPETSADEGRGPARKMRSVSRGGGQSRAVPKFGTTAMKDTLVISSDSGGDSEIEAGPVTGGMNGKKSLGVARKSVFANGSGYKPGGSKGKEALFVEEDFDYGDSDMSQ